jgi:hypothetical protein
MTPTPVDIRDNAGRADCRERFGGPGPFTLRSARRQAAAWLLMAPPRHARLDARPWLRWTHGGPSTNAQIEWILRKYPELVSRVMREFAVQVCKASIAGAV